jgi:hypothetical protein
MVPSAPIAGDDAVAPMASFHFRLPLLALVSYGLKPVCFRFW